MRLKAAHIICIALSGIIQIATMHARHPFRTPDPHETRVTIYAKGYKPHTIWSNRLRLYPLFAFHMSDLRKDIIPHGSIAYRTDPLQSVTGKHLSDLSERVVDEVIHNSTQVKKDRATKDCIILRDKNFNYKTLHGLIIFACKNYPFVIKLFIENPYSFFDFRSTGMEPPFFFYMGGGANRYLTGLTRIKNRNLVAQAIGTHAQWKNRIEIPRKWFWLPKKQHNLYLLGEKIGNHQKIHTVLPSIYAIIEDKINLQNQTVSLSNQEKRNIIITLCNDLNLYIDPHTTNYAFIKDDFSPYKIAILDTEHFPTMAGIQKRIHFKSHWAWYVFLAKNYLKTLYLQTKKDLIDMQSKISAISIFKPII